MKFGHQQKIQKLHIYSLSIPRAWIKLIFCSMCSGQTWPLAKVPHILFFYPRELKLSLFSLYGHFPKYETWPQEKGQEFVHTVSFYPSGWNWAYFCSTVFWDMSHFSKLPYLGMKLGHRTKFKKLHIQCLSTPGDWNWAYLFLYEQRFLTYVPIVYIAMFGHEIWQLPKDSEVSHILSFYPRGSKLNLLSLYGQQYSRYRPIFKIAIFAHETWTWNLAIGQSSRSCTYKYSLSTPRQRRV